MNSELFLCFSENTLQKIFQVRGFVIILQCQTKNNKNEKTLQLWKTLNLKTK